MADELSQVVQELSGEQSSPDLFDDVSEQTSSAEQSEQQAEPAEQEQMESAEQGEQSSQEQEQAESAKQGEQTESAQAKLADEVKALKAQLEMLLKLQKGEIGEQSSPPDEAGVGEQSSPPKVEIDVDIDEGAFEELMESPKAFKEWAKKFAEKIADRTLEAVYQNVPDLIRRYADETVTVRTYAQRFYEENPDLKPYKVEVARIANVIAQAEPNLSYEEFFKKVADFARYTLGLYKQASEAGETDETKSRQRRRPALPEKSTGGRRKPETVEGMEKEILELISSM